MTEQRMSEREYALGWLVLGLGYSIPTATNIVSNASTPNIERWVALQKQALIGFIKMIDEA